MGQDNFSLQGDLGGASDGLACFGWTEPGALGAGSGRMKSPSGFKGNKQSLPSKACVACGRPMSWRKRWARTWDEVKFCSDACRKRRAGGGA